MNRDPFHQTRVLRAPSSLALNPAREGAATAPLGNLGQGLTTLMVKNFFLISNPKLPSFSLKPFPLALPIHWEESQALLPKQETAGARQPLGLSKLQEAGTQRCPTQPPPRAPD